jgi:hypothetical protein
MTLPRIKLLVSRFCIPTKIPWKYLRGASIISLESYELVSLARAEKARKKIIDLLSEWMEEMTAAAVAREFIEEARLRIDSNPAQKCFEFVEGAWPCRAKPDRHVEGAAYRRAAAD